MEWLMDRREYLAFVGGTGATVLGGYGVYTSFFRTANGSDDSANDDGSEGDSESNGADSDDSDEDVDAETRDGWLLLGVTPSERDVRVLNPFEEWIDKRHAVVGKFVDMNHSDDEIDWLANGLFETTWGRDQIPHVFWQPFFPSQENASQDVCTEIAAGEYDDRIEAWASTLSEWATETDGPDRRIYLNLAPEMNGDWSPWSPALGDDTEEDFVEMWRRIHDIHADTNLEEEHVQWVWTLDNTTRGVDREAVYPGDDYVDWVSIHGYNWTRWGPWISPEEVYGPTIDVMRSITDKPLAITEFACSSETDDGGNDPERKDEWIEDGFEYLREQDVRMSLYFNLTKETDWAVFDAEHGTETVTIDDQEYEASAAYREAVDDDGILPSHPDYDRVLTDEEFTGEFADD